MGSTTGQQTPYLPLVGWYKQIFFTGPFFTGPFFFRPFLFPALIIAAFDQIGRIRAGKKRADKVYNYNSILRNATANKHPTISNIHAQKSIINKKPNISYYINASLLYQKFTKQ